MEIAEAIEKTVQPRGRGRGHRGRALLHDDARRREAELGGRDLVHARGLPRAAADARRVPGPAAPKAERAQIASQPFRCDRLAHVISSRSGRTRSHSAARSSTVSTSPIVRRTLTLRPRRGGALEGVRQDVGAAPADALEQLRAAAASARSGSTRRPSPGPIATSWSSRLSSACADVLARERGHVGPRSGPRGARRARRLLERARHPRTEVVPATAARAPRPRRQPLCDRGPVRPADRTRARARTRRRAARCAGPPPPAIARYTAAAASGPMAAASRDFTAPGRGLLDEDDQHVRAREMRPISRSLDRNWPCIPR